MLSESQDSKMELISKYLAGEASPEEAIALHEWLENVDNRKEFDKIEKTWRILSIAQMQKEIPVSKAFEMVKQELGLAKKQKKVFKMHWSHLVAASIIGLAFLSITFWLASDKRSAKLTTETAKAEQKISTRQNRTIRDTLQDGSVVTINKNSELIYSKDWGRLNREVRLEGEAFFNVAPSKTKPFVISIDDLKVQVIGTSFNVRQGDSVQTIEVSVKSGIVRMFTTKNELTLSKGQTGIYEKNTGALVARQGIDENNLAYATKRFFFNDISLRAACDYLEKAFAVQILLQGDKLEALSITSQFEDKPLAYILDVINETLNTKHETINNTVIITKKNSKN